MSKECYNNKWARLANENDGKITTRGSGNYGSDEAKEIAKIKQELKVILVKHQLTQLTVITNLIDQNLDNKYYLYLD